MVMAWQDKKLPWEPPDYDDDVIYAVRALAAGIASDHQQKLAWTYLMHITKASDEFQSLSFRPGAADGERATAFAEGKRFVGMMLRKLFRPELTPKPKNKAEAEKPASKSRRTLARHKQ